MVATHAYSEEASNEDEQDADAAIQTEASSGEESQSHQYETMRLENGQEEEMYTKINMLPSYVGPKQSKQPTQYVNIGLSNISKARVGKTTDWQKHHIGIHAAFCVIVVYCAT